MVDASDENEGSVLLANPHEVVRDCSLIGRALRAGWSTPGQMAELECKAREMALQLGDDPKNAKAFTALTRVTFAIYHERIKLAERQEKIQRAGEPRDSKRQRGELSLIIPRAIAQPAGGATVESGRQQLLERIRAARGVGGDSGGPGGSREVASGT